MTSWPDFKSGVLSTMRRVSRESDPVEYQKAVETLPVDVRVAGPDGPLYVTEASMYVRYLRTVLMPLHELFTEDLPAALEAGRLPEWADAHEPTIEQTKALLDGAQAPQEAAIAKELFLHSLAACSLAATWWQVGGIEEGIEDGKVAIASWWKAVVELERVEAIVIGVNPGRRTLTPTSPR